VIKETGSRHSEPASWTLNWRHLAAGEESVGP